MKPLSLTSILFIVCLLPLSSSAQFFDSYSVVAIGNRSNVINNDFQNFRNYKFGFGLGAHASKKLSTRFTLVTGLELSALRYELETSGVVLDSNGIPTGETYGDKAVSSLFILSIPAMIKINLPANYHGYIGPRLDIELGSQKGVLNFEVQDNQFREKDKLSNYSELLVPGWTAGIGKRFDFGGIQPYLELRYSGDLTNIVLNEGFLNMRKKRFNF